MAKLWIREFVNNAVAGAGRPVQISAEPGTDQAPVTFTTTTQSAAFAASTKYIGIASDAAYHYVVGSNPTATTGALRVPADTILYIGVTAGHKIAVVTAA